MFLTSHFSCKLKVQWWYLVLQDPHTFNNLFKNKNKCMEERTQLEWCTCSWKASRTLQGSNINASIYLPDSWIHLNSTRLAGVRSLWHVPFQSDAMFPIFLIRNGYCRLTLDISNNYLNHQMVSWTIQDFSIFLLLPRIPSILKPLEPPEPLAAQVGTYLVSIWHAPSLWGWGYHVWKNIPDSQ